MDPADEQARRRAGAIITRRPLLADLWMRSCVQLGLSAVDVGAIDRSVKVALTLVDLGDRIESTTAAVDGPVVLLIDGPLTSRLVDALRHGVSAVVTWRDGKSELEAAMVRVLGGGCYISPTAAPAALTACVRLAHADATSSGRLTPREIDVLRAMMDGHTVKSTARKLGVAAKTVEAHRSSAFVKLGVRGHNEAIGRLFREPGLLEQSDC